MLSCTSRFDLGWDRG